MRTWSTCAALVIGMSAAPLSTPAAGDSATWMREQVRQHQLLTFRRSVGARAANHTVGPQIVGGKAAPAGMWPFQVALLDTGEPNNADAQFCGGSLISSRHVLTAAHCVKGMRPAKLLILTGTQSLKSGGTRRRVASIRVHPKYNASTSDYDIAVVTMKTAVTGIRAAQMLTTATERTLAKPGILAYVTGWGALNEAGTRFPTVLHQVNVPLVSKTVCNRPQSYDGEITSRMICAGYAQGRKDACQGDSGGPLIVRDSTGKWRMQAGVVSFGEGCALKDFYGVYARVAVLRTWVMSVVNSTRPPLVAKSCESLTGAPQGACLDQAIASAAAETGDYLDQIRRAGTRTQSQAVEAAQRTWSTSLASLCAFDAASGGEAGRKACVLREMRNRAASLAGHLSAVDSD